MSRRYTRFTGLAQVAELRTATFMGQKHLVVPVVALVGDSVVYPMGAPGPELVPAAVLARSVREWNGRPVVGDHPADEGTPLSANDPETYERTCFGRIANPRWEDGRLKVDAYLDPERAEQVGRDAVRVCERVKAGEMVEVSIGAYVEVHERRGTTAGGEEYVGVWSEVGSDHLAMLPEGAEGACSIEMGCGAPRAAANGGKMASKDAGRIKDKLNTAGLLDALKRGLGFRSAQDEVSDVDLREKLWDALRASEPGFDGIVEVFPDGEAGTVIYIAMPEDRMQWMRRSYSMSDGEVELSDDRQEVEPVTRYEPVGAGARSAVQSEDLRQWLQDAAEEVESPFDHLYVESFDPDEGTFVYYMRDEDGEGHYYQRTYQVDADAETVTIGDERARMRRRTTYEDDPDGESRQARESPADTPCGCNTERPLRVAQTDTAAKAEGDPMATIKDLVGRLITCEKSPFTEKDRKMLEAGTEETLQALADQYAAPEKPEPEPVEEPESAEEDDDPAAEKIAELERKLKQYEPAALAYERQQKERHAALVAKLTGAQSAYDEEELKAEPVDRLEKLAKALKLDEPKPDYSGAGIPELTGAEADEADYMPPDIYGLRKSSKADGKEAN